MTLAYHGTPLPERILTEGLRAGKADSSSCAHIWLAKSPRDAAMHGVVLEVDMTGLDFGWMDEDEPDYPCWQGCYHGGDISADRLKVWS